MTINSDLSEETSSKNGGGIGIQALPRLDTVPAQTPPSNTLSLQKHMEPPGRQCEINDTAHWPSM